MGGASARVEQACSQPADGCLRVTERSEVRVGCPLGVALEASAPKGMTSSAAAVGVSAELTITASGASASVVSTSIRSALYVI